MLLCACEKQPLPAKSTTAGQSETTSAPDSDTTAESQTEIQEAQLYTQYLTGGTYNDFLPDYDDPETEFEAESVLADVNDDGVRELLLHVTDKSLSGVRGFYAVTVLLGIQDGEVKRLGFAEYGGGSGGGDYLFVKYDTAEKKHVLQYEEFLRDGMFFSTYALHVFDVTQTDTQEKMLGLSGTGDVVYKTLHTLRTVTLYKDGTYAEDAERIMTETDLYELDDGLLTVWEYDDTYITEAQYDEIAARYVEPTDPAYQMKPVTLQDPIPE